MPSNDIYHLENQETIRPTCLYIKQHSITGLKYFGKTVRDPHKYLGSGTHWLSHIKKHGKEFIETLWVSEPYTDANLIKEIALKFSFENNIVESPEWANLKFEDGLDGGNLNLSKESLEECRQSGMKGGISSRDNKVGIFAMNPLERMQARIKGRDACFEKYGVISVFSLLNKDPEFQTKRKESLSKIGHQQGNKNSQSGKVWIYNLVLKLNKKSKKKNYQIMNSMAG